MIYSSRCALPLLSPTLALRGGLHRPTPRPSRDSGGKTACFALQQSPGVLCYTIQFRDSNRRTSGFGKGASVVTRKLTVLAIALTAATVGTAQPTIRKGSVANAASYLQPGLPNY